MSTIRDAYASKYLKPGDLKGPTRATIAFAELTDFNREGEPKKLILSFFHGLRPMVVNKTNAQTLIENFGDQIEPDDLIDKTVVLTPGTTEYDGKTVATIILTVPRPTNGSGTNGSTGERADEANNEAETPAPVLDDEVPF